MRRAGVYIETAQLELYMHPHYKFNITRDSLHRTRDLVRRAREFETLEDECRARQTPSRDTNNAASTYNCAECC